LQSSSCGEPGSTGTSPACGQRHAGRAACTHLCGPVSKRQRQSARSAPHCQRQQNGILLHEQPPPSVCFVTSKKTTRTTPNAAQVLLPQTKRSPKPRPQTLP
jgi:hypothetical protein